MTVTVGHLVAAHHRPVSRRLRVALLAGGRSSEHEISLASARSVLAALDPERYEVVERRDRPRRTLGARAELLRPCPDAGDRAGPRGGAAGRDAARSGRGRNAPRRSAPSTSSCRSCTARSARTAPCRGCSSSPTSRTSAPASPASALGDGQGPVQEGDARQRHPGRRAPCDPARRRAREPVRLPGLRQARAAWLLRRHLEGARRRRSSRPPSRSRSGTTRRCSSRSSWPGRRSRSACSATACRLRRLAAGADRHARARVVRLRARSTTRAAWSSSSRRRLPGETIELLQSRGRRRFVAGRVRGARARRLLRPRRRRRGRPQRAEHDARLHRDERLGDAFRGESGSATTEALDRLIELALERHERRSKFAVLASLDLVHVRDAFTRSAGS